MPKLRLVQLPVPPPAALAATGNVPLAAGCLGVAARVHGLDRRLEIEVLEPAATDVLGDTLLADRIAREEPEFVGFSLYLWNSERSLHLAREVKRRSPRTKILIGGPEVGPDNAFILQQPGADIAVTGEAEDTFARVMSALLDGTNPAGLPGVAVRGPPEGGRGTPDARAARGEAPAGSDADAGREAGTTTPEGTAPGAVARLTEPLAAVTGTITRARSDEPLVIADTPRPAESAEPWLWTRAPARPRRGCR